MVKANRVLILSMRYGYGDPGRGDSYEWLNFYLSLQRICEAVDFFDVLEAGQNYSPKEIEQQISQKVAIFKPDVIFYIPYKYDISLDFLQSLRQNAKILCYFFDDTWRQDFVKHWLPACDAITTTHIRGETLYRDQGYAKAYFLPYGINPELFPLASHTKDIEVSFVGSWHPYREWLVKRLRAAGIQVEAYGYRWPNGVISHEKMVEIFSRSKISLNLSNSACWDVRYLLANLRNMINTLKSQKIGEQLKARFAEICACKTMQLSYYVEGLPDLFAIGKELQVFMDVDDLIEKTTFYLQHDDVRESMAQAGYEKVMACYSYEQLFAHLFKRLGWRT